MGGPQLAPHRGQGLYAFIMHMTHEMEIARVRPKSMLRHTLMTNDYDDSLIVKVN
jgi:hypothetical protein